MIQVLYNYLVSLVARRVHLTGVSQSLALASSIFSCLHTCPIFITNYVVSILRISQVHFIPYLSDCDEGPPKKCRKRKKRRPTIEKKAPSSTEASTPPNMGCPSDEPLTIPASLLGEYWSLVILFFHTCYMAWGTLFLTNGNTHKNPLKIWNMSFVIRSIALSTEALPQQ